MTAFVFVADLDVLPAEHDLGTADRCARCAAAIPWSDVAVGRSLRVPRNPVVHPTRPDMRLCAVHTAERAR